MSRLGRLAGMVSGLSKIITVTPASSSRGTRFVAGLLLIFLALIASGLPIASQAALIQRTITIDGDVSDWTGPTDITSNPDQFSTDGDGRSCPSTDLDTGSPCKSLTPSGRDLQTFAFTWDLNNLYIFVQRWEGTDNPTEWWFYLDTDADDLMETGEPVLRVTWFGNTRLTNRYLYTYTASAAGGDPLVNPVADGYTMPGAIALASTLASATGGTVGQSSMESWIAWTDIGLTVPSTVKFHIASSNNASSMPGSTIDNMDGPAGGTILIPPDIVIAKTVLTTSDPVNGISANAKAIPGATALYNISVSNSGFGPTDTDSVIITDPVPANTELYVGDLGGGPVIFIGPGSGLTYTYGALNNMTDDLSFSDDNGATWNYVPTPDTDGYDSAVTTIRINPKGALAASDGVTNPSFQLRFQVRVQ